jgi:SIR2-like domain
MPNEHIIDEIFRELEAGNVIPYIGPGIWAATGTLPPFPPDHLALVNELTARSSVPHRIRKNLTAAAQYIENFKHRKTLAKLMNGQFEPAGTPTVWHAFLASSPNIPLIVDAWYDGTMQQALINNPDWGQVQSVSQAEHHGEWVRYYRADGSACDAAEAAHWRTLLYRPLGSAHPAQNYIVSDSDYVEILTEIDIQTPIPPEVQRRRTGKSFLFIGCRFSYQLDRIFARQIMKRSSGRHWALIPGELTKNEQKFLREMNITRLDLPIHELAMEGRTGD